MTAVAVRLVRLHAASRRLPAALALLAVCAAGLRGVLYGHWDDYGALQLPLIFETACAAIIAVTAGSPFGEPERATGRWLPYLRLGTAVSLTGLASGALAAAGTGMPLAGTGRLDPHGMIVIPALHDAASDQPLRYTPACSRTPIPVCVNPAYAGFLPAVTATVGPELTEFAGLPGAPARLSQVPSVYRQVSGNGINVSGSGSSAAAFVVPDQVPGWLGTTGAEFAAQLDEGLGLKLASDVILGDGQKSAAAPTQAQLAVIAGSVRFPPSVEGRDLAPMYGQLLPEPGSPADLAGRRFAALSPAAKHAWLAQHLTALRAGRVSPAQLP